MGKGSLVSGGDFLKSPPLCFLECQPLDKAAAMEK